MWYFETIMETWSRVKFNCMIIINYILIVFLGTGWAVSILGFHPGREVHILLVLAMITASAIMSREELSLNGENIKIKNA